MYNRPEKLEWIFLSFLYGSMECQFRLRTRLKKDIHWTENLFFKSINLKSYSFPRTNQLDLVFQVSSKLRNPQSNSKSYLENTIFLNMSFPTTNFPFMMTQESWCIFSGKLLQVGKFLMYSVSLARLLIHPSQLRQGWTGLYQRCRRRDHN